MVSPARLCHIGQDIPRWVKFIGIHAACGLAVLRYGAIHLATPKKESLVLRVIILVIVNVAALAAAIYLALFLPAATKAWFFPYEKAYEVTLQFLLVVVLGSAIALAYRSLEFSRDRRLAQREELENFYKDLLQAHHACKRVRRLLRASCIDYRYCQKQTFEHFMVKLEDAELKYETLVEEVKARKALFARDRDSTIKNSLATAKEYL